MKACSPVNNFLSFVYKGNIMILVGIILYKRTYNIEIIVYTICWKRVKTIDQNKRRKNDYVIGTYILQFALEFLILARQQTLQTAEITSLILPDSV